LVGVDGHRKMSKSLANEIGLTDPPQEMYGKTMSIPDEATADYRRLLLDPPGGDAGGPAGGRAADGTRAQATHGRSARGAKPPLAPGEHDVPSERAEGKLLRVGRRRFRRLRSAS